MGKLKIWAPQEDQILIRISSTIKSKKWKKASQELRRKGFDRTDVQCRERYINHLDPNVNKQLWSSEELQTLYSKYSEYGNKWFLLQRHLPGRTQTKIKNYFYGNIRYLLKLIVKYFLKKSTGFINDIKTDALLEMYQAKNNYEAYSVIYRTIKKLKFKIEKKSCQKIIRQSKQTYQNFLNHFMQQFSQKNSPVMKEVDEQNGQSYSLSYYQDENGEKEQNLENQEYKCKCEPIRITLVSSIAGIVTDKISQLQHLQNMADRHLQLHNHYQTAYYDLLKSQDNE